MSEALFIAKPLIEGSVEYTSRITGTSYIVCPSGNGAYQASAPGLLFVSPDKPSLMTMIETADANPNTG